MISSACPQRSRNTNQGVSISTEFDCQRISVIIHRSASDNLPLIDWSCSFGTDSYSPKKIEKECLTNCFQSKICELASGKLSKCLYRHSYTNLITLSALNESL